MTLSRLFDEDFDAAALEGRAAKPVRVGLGVVLAVFFAFGLGWKPMLAWAVVMLAVETWSWFDMGRWPKDGPPSQRQRWRFLAVMIIIGVIWLIPCIMMWRSGEPGLQVAAVTQWMANILYVQHHSYRSRLFSMVTAAVQLVALLLAATLFLPFRGTDAAAPCAVMIMAGLSGLQALRGSRSRHNRAQRMTNELVEQRAIAEAANEAKSAFLAMMSHELRTPMNGVLGMAHALQTTKLTKQQADYVAVILRSGDGLMTVLNDVLDLSKIEAGRFDLNPAPTDLRDLVARAMDMWTETARSKDLALTWSVDARISPALLVDAARLRQMLLNLVSNALKFTTHGAVTVHAGLSDDGAILRLTVTDTGPGIDPDTQSRLFEAFAQADADVSRTHGGTGLGLAITRRLANLMGGDVDLHSIPGQGATFTITLPAVAADPAAEPEGQDEAIVAGPHLRLLVAEDNPTNQLVIRALLGSVGLEPTIVGDGEEALSALMSADYDLILMDVQMPRMGGIEATAAIRAGKAGRRDIPIIALTADAMTGDRERFLAAGFDEHLAKPISPAALFAALDAFAGPAPARTEAQVA